MAVLNYSREPGDIAAGDSHPMSPLSSVDFTAVNGQWPLFLLRQLGGAIAFYTCIPIPATWPLELQGIARWAPLVGLLIGGLLGLLDQGLEVLGTPSLTRSGLIVAAWIAITGGLHLDGAMDTADGLAVPDPERRLAAMADSRTGAFGVMAAAVILILKTAALAELSSQRFWLLIAVGGWGRWGQLVAIAAYPYLKPAGKGAFHKAAIQFWDLLPSTLLLLGLSTLWMANAKSLWPGMTALMGSTIGLGLGWWLRGKLGGHTGDTYGAIVEWTEALLLCGLVSLPPW